MCRSNKLWALALRSLLYLGTFSNLLFAQQPGDVFDNRDNSPVTKQLFNILMSQREVEYFATPLYFDSSKFGLTHDSVPASHTISFFEANLAPYYIMFKGRDMQRDWLKRLSVVFEPQMTFRIYLVKAQSYPVRPPNFHPKFHFNYFIHKKLEPFTTRFQYLTLTIAHLSNGQPRPFFLDPDKRIVNLRNGNFSTNYLRLGYTFSQYQNPKTDVDDPDGWRSNSNWSATVALQREMSIGKVLAFDTDLDAAGYGHYRLVTRLQFRSGNFRGLKALFSAYDQPAVFQALSVPIVERDSMVLRDGIEIQRCLLDRCYIIRKLDEVKNKHPRGYWNWMTRWDNTLVLDENAINRNSTDIVFELRNLNWRSFCLVAKCSWGRDYINLRFGENIQSYQIGISYNMDRYQVPYTKYVESFQAGDVINHNYTRNGELSDLGWESRIDTFTTRQPYPLYNMKLEERATPPPPLDLSGNLFAKPACFRFDDGAWKLITSERSKLKKVKKAGWYDPKSFEYDKDLNGFR